MRPIDDRTGTPATLGDDGQVRHGRSSHGAFTRTHEEPRRMLEALLGVPFSEGNRIDVLRNGDEIFPAWLEAIGQSTRSIDLLAYLWGKGPITREVGDALVDRARAGVRVRVLLDALGSKGIDRSILGDLRGAGAQVAFYRPVPNWRITAVNARTHRRALICDEEVAFTGGTGIDRAWTGAGRTRGDWRDTAFRLRGPVVDGVRGAFATAWIQTPHPLLAAEDRFPALPPAGNAAVQVLRSASQPGWNDSMVALVALLQLARERVDISTPYARMPVHLLHLVTGAARRGVQVRLLVPGPHVDHPLVRLQGDHDHDALLNAGVEIWCYQPSMLHTKAVTVDGRLAMVGSVNFDARALVLNEQVALVVSDAATTAALDRDFEEDLEHSRQMTREEWSRRGRRRQVLETVAHAAGRPVRGMGAAGMTGVRPGLPWRGRKWPVGRSE
jgi:cardiolipin synthase